jgi:hypothetical protein
MVMYINTHAALEQMREKAETDNTRGPRVGNWWSHSLVLSIYINSNLYIHVYPLPSNGSRHLVMIRVSVHNLSSFLHCSFCRPF